MEASAFGMLGVPAITAAIVPGAFTGSVDPLPGLVFLEGLAGWGIVAVVLPMHLRPPLRRRFAEWRAFRRHLQHFSSLRDAPAEAVIVWEDYLPYAVALGV